MRSKRERKKCWEENKRSFERNLAKIIHKLNKQKGWKVFTVAGNFLTQKEVPPYGKNAWSCTLVAGATKRQGFEILLFINKSPNEFLSLPALIPLVVHEFGHVQQIVRSAKDYQETYFNDTLARKDEKDAEKYVRKLPQEFADEAALESILYCYDKGGWGMAEKMANNLYKKQAEGYSGGYDDGMTKRQHLLFLEAKRIKNVDKLIAEF